MNQKSVPLHDLNQMKITLRQKLGPPGCPYLIRWIFSCSLFSIRLHHWLKSDDLRAQHDHEWDFISIVIKGKIIDRTDQGDEIRKAGNIKFFPAEHKHIAIIQNPCWTLILTGRSRRIWGYWVKNKFRKRNKYYFENDHHDPRQ